MVLVHCCGVLGYCTIIKGPHASVYDVRISRLKAWVLSSISVGMFCLFYHLPGRNHNSDHLEK